MSTFSNSELYGTPQPDTEKKLDVSKPVEIGLDLFSHPYEFPVENSDRGLTSLAEYAVRMSRYVRIAQYIENAYPTASQEELQELYIGLADNETISDTNRELVDTIVPATNEARIHEAVQKWYSTASAAGGRRISLWDATLEYQSFRDLLLDKKRASYIPGNSLETQMFTDPCDRNYLRASAHSNETQNNLLETMAYEWALEESGLEEFAQSVDIKLTYALARGNSDIPQVVIDIDDICVVLGCTLSADTLRKFFAGEDEYASGIVFQRGNTHYLLTTSIHTPQIGTDTFSPAADIITTPENKSYIVTTVDSQEGGFGQIKLSVSPYGPRDTAEAMAYLASYIPSNTALLQHRYR